MYNAKETRFFLEIVFIDPTEKITVILEPNVSN